MDQDDIDDFVADVGDLMARTPGLTDEDYAAGLDSFFDTEAYKGLSRANQPEFATLRRTRVEQPEVWLANPAGWANFCLKENPYHLFSVERLRGAINPPSRTLNALLPKGYQYQHLQIRQTWAGIFDNDEVEPTERVPVWRSVDDPYALLRLVRAQPERGWSRIVVHMSRPTATHTVHDRRRVQEWVFRVTQAYPEARLHLAGTGSFSAMFGHNYIAASFRPYTRANMGFIVLPSGKSVHFNALRRHLKWVHVLGFSVKDLHESTPSRVAFNIRAALWAAEHWNDPVGLEKKSQWGERTDPLGLLASPDRVLAAGRTRIRRATLGELMNQRPPDPDDYPQMCPDPEEPYAYAEPVVGAPLIPISPRGKSISDKVLCDSCSLADTCRQYRERSVCTVKDAEASGLVAMFGSRDVDVIRDALRVVIARQAERYERSADAFRRDEESDIMDLRRSEHLMKMENSLLRSSEAMVKLLDPAYRMSSVPAISGPQTHIYNPRILVADLVKQLEASGVDRSSIDARMLVETAEKAGLTIEGGTV